MCVCMCVYVCSIMCVHIVSHTVCESHLRVKADLKICVILKSTVHTINININDILYAMHTLIKNGTYS